MPAPTLRHATLALAVPALMSLLGAAETITVVPAATHQTIEAWGAAGGAFAYSKKDSLRPHLIDEAVNSLGLTRTRIEAQNGNFTDSTSWERLNDNGDSAALDPSKLSTNEFDSNVSRWAVPMKQLVEANGETFTSYFSPSFYDTGSTGTAPAWQLGNPGEHAEYLLSYLQRLKNVHGITPTYCTILNEAGYHNAWDANTVGKMIKTAGPRFQAAGLPTKIQFPEGFSPMTAWNSVTTLQNDPEVWPHIGMLSYHVYGTADPYRTNLRDFGNSRNLRRAQTESMYQNIDKFYSDLTLADVSVWELYTWTSYYNLTENWFSRLANFWTIRQITHYVRPGSVRVDATSTSASIRPLAFLRGGKATVVLLNNTGGAATTADVAGLAPGAYGVCRTDAGRGIYTEVGVFTVPASGVLAGVNVPSNHILTLYPHSGNLPPTIVDWKSSAQFLTLPASTTTLSAAAQDPELDAVSFTWTVLSKPAGTTVALATPAAATCAASGLTAAGDYVFQVAIKDPTHTILRTVEVTAYSSNQPPVLNGVHNRNPVIMTLPTATATTLRAGASDLEGDAISLLWTVASAPAGATVTFSAPTTGDCIASGMTVAGNYVFQIAASDPTHTVTKQLTVPVYPANTAPVVSSLSASPASITLPTASTTLAAVTSDPDAAAFAPWRAGGDVLTHWWEATSVPAGAKPVFATPGARTTTVSGLSVAGTYTFKLSAMDRTAIASKTVTVTVAAGGGTAPEIALSRGGTAVADGGTDTVAGLVAGSPTVLTYVVANTGTAALSLGTPTLGTKVNCTATLSTAPAASVAAGGSTTLALTITPTAAGAWSCPVASVTNDSDENPTNWTIGGTATAAPTPEIALSRSGTAVADGGTDTVTGLIAGTTGTLTYQIANSGSATLTVGAPVLSSLVNCTASVTTAPAASVAAGGNTLLVVQVTPSAAGNWSVALSCASNDSDENPTNWTIGGTATAAVGVVPAPWTALDLGATGALGQSAWTASPDVWTISGAGTGIAGINDACQLAYRPVSGDFDLTARLPFLPLTTATAQVGLVMREKLTTNARVAFVGLLGSKQVAWAQRKEAATITQTVKTVSQPPWVRLSRRGNLISSWYSTDGTTWLAAGKATTMALPDQVQLGLCVASGSSGTLMTATLEQVAVSLPTPSVPGGIRINFQPSTSPTLVLGGVTWLPADGSVFGQRWNGLSYGCDAATTATLNRNSTLSADERYDTCLNPAQLTRTFAVGLPNGSYTVTVCVGEPNASSGVLAPEVQGVRVVTGTASTTTRWFTGTVIVDVVNGRLVLSCGSGSTASRWAWLQIDPVAPAPGGTG